MPRAIWKGSIAFGLVNIPVSLMGAESRPDVQLHMVDSSNHARIRYERVNADTGEEVPWDRIVKGYEHDDGQFILLTEEELAAVQPKLTKTIEITEFVELADIDPILFEKPYYLEPEKRGRKAYALLREAMRESGKAGIARVVVRTREYLSAMFVRGDVMILMLLRFPQEIRSADKLELPSSDSKEWQPAKKEMSLAAKLIDEMTVEWKPQEFHDDYREALMDYVNRKVASGDTVSDVIESSDEDDEKGGKVLDLAEHLERSFKGAGASKAPKKKSPPAKKTPTKKHASKKVAAKKSSSGKGRRSA